MIYKFKVSKTELLILILMAPFIRPNGIHVIINNSQYLYDVLSLISLSILVVLRVSNRKRKNHQSDKQLIYLLVMFAVIGIVTMYNRENSLVHLRVFTTCFGIVMLVNVFRDRLNLVLAAAFFELEVMIYINALCILAFPNGMYMAHGTFGSRNNWFMGYDNHWFIFYYAAFCLSILNLKYGKIKIRSYIMLAVLHITSIRVMSGVLVFGLLMMDIILLSGIYKSRLFSIKTITIASLLLTIIFVFFANNSYIQYLVDSVFNKSNSIAARGRIWSTAWEMFLANPIFGNGRWSEISSVSLYRMPAGVNAHNMWLEILFEGGSVSFVMFLLFILTADNGDHQSHAYRIILIPIATIMTAMTVDALIDTRGVMFFFFIAVACCMSSWKESEDYRAKA